MYALMSLGLVMVHRVSTTINFAQGAIAMVGTYVYWDIYQHSSFWVAYPIALVATSALGAVIYFLIIRPLRNASQTARLLATLGVLATITAAVSLVFPAQEEIVPSSLPSRGVHLLGATLGESQLWLFGIATVLTIGLALLYRFARFGLATSAVAESTLVSEAMGVSADRTAAANWALASGLAVTAGVLLAPIAGLDVTEYTALLIPALAAAVVGNMTSFPLTFLAALVIGVAQSEISHYVSTPGWTDVVPLVLGVAAVAVRGRVIPARGEQVGRVPTVGTGRVRPVGVAIAVGIGVAITLLAPVTWVAGLIISLSTVIILTSLVVVTGYTGQLSLCQFALAGIGAYVAGRLVAAHHFPFVVALLIALVVAIAAGLVVALPALRSRGSNLAVATLLLAFAIEALIFDSASLTGGDLGTQVTNVKLFGIPLDAINKPRTYALVTMAFAAIAGLAVANLRRSGTGRRLLAVRSNERAAAALGIPIVRMKARGFMIGSVLAALGGVLYAFANSIIEYSTFTGLDSVNMAAFTIVGGVGYVIGPYWGAALQPGGIGTNIGQLFSSDVQNYLLLIGGVSLILVVLQAPDGLAPKTIKDLRTLGRALSRLYRRVRSRVAAPTPSPAVVGGPLAMADGGSVAARTPGQLAAVGSPREAAGPGGSLTAQGVDEDARGGRLRGWLDSYPLRPGPLTVSNVTVQYGGQRALDDVSLQLESGRVLGVIGPNGAGKSTLIEVIMGFVHPRQGRVSIGGRDITRLQVERRADFGIGMTFQSLELFEDMTVRENLVLGDEGRYRSSTFHDLVRPGRARQSVGFEALLDIFELGPELDTLVRELPYGRRRVVAMARSLLGSPSFLLLDEPVAGVNRSDADELATAITSLADRGVGVMLIEHDVEFVMSVAQRVTVLDFGRVIATGSPSEVRRHPDVIRAYLGDLSVEPPTQVPTQ
jgi:sulfate-transporting ATPase